MIVVRATDVERMNRHGEQDYPRECCGLLIGSFSPSSERVVHEVVPISNAREEPAKRNRFLITAEELMRGERYARRTNRDVVGFYHSHPDHPAEPSAFDLEHAWPRYSYIIVSVEQGTATNVASWQLQDDRSRFDSEQIVTRGE